VYSHSFGSLTVDDFGIRLPFGTEVSRHCFLHSDCVIAPVLVVVYPLVQAVQVSEFPQKFLLQAQSLLIKVALSTH
jgi:hypothetical protein